jgi:glycine C-acetyltransferase
MYSTLKQQLNSELEEIRKQNLFKIERTIESPQEMEIVVNGKKVINFCANNYLGLANDPIIVKDAKKALDKWGFGLCSVRFICGSLSIHKELEKQVSTWLETDDTILYSSCFEANTGFFETLTTKEDVIISDKLNHASIIDGIRLSKAERIVFEHMDMVDLKNKLQNTASFRRRIIVTDGVFSMDGDIAPLKEICDLADEFNALVMVDDSHATGVIGPTGRGSIEHCGVIGRVDVITSTFSKALGGAGGGFTTGRKEIIDYLRQRSRPYIFSNSLPPVITSTTINIIKHLKNDYSRLDLLNKNTQYFRNKISAIGLEVRQGSHPLVPIMLYDAEKAQKMATELLKANIYVIGFYYPVVPKGTARIRVQISSAHTKQQLDQAIEAFEKVGKKLGIIPPV